MLFPLLFKRWREGAIGGLILLCLMFLGQWKKADTALKEARLAYEHPATKESVRETSTGGAEVTVTRTWSSTPTKKNRIGTKLVPPSPTPITETISWKAPVTVTRETAAESAPVPVGTILAPARTDRWLLSAGLTQIDRGVEGKALLAGYGWHNRLDLQAGLYRRDGHTHPLVLATLRF